MMRTGSRCWCSWFVLLFWWRNAGQISKRVTATFRGISQNYFSHKLTWTRVPCNIVENFKDTPCDQAGNDRFEYFMSRSSHCWLIMAIVSFTLNPEALGKLHEALVCLGKFSEAVSLEASHDRVSNSRVVFDSP
jgi:hypothetical protein